MKNDEDDDYDCDWISLPAGFALGYIVTGAILSGLGWVLTLIYILTR